MLNLGPDIEKLSADVFQKLRTFLEHYYCKRGLKGESGKAQGHIFVLLSYKHRVEIEVFFCNLDIYVK